MRRFERLAHVVIEYLATCGLLFFLNKMSTTNAQPPPAQHSAANNDDDEDDEWDKRIRRTGCFKENEELLICHADTNDWRKCLRELTAFKQCMQANKPSA
ncbi:hypothetical protein GGH96_004501 [Coemansia sp. RSA 1972]|nr:hypothetical protein GGH96_004501 [Coemansia sp. RSA 1972]